MPVWLTVLCWTVGVFAVVYALSGLVIFVVACTRVKQPDWHQDAQVQKSHYGKYADSIAQVNQWMEEHNAQDVQIVCRDGLKLHGYWVPAEKPKATILLAHGYRSTWRIDFGPVLEMYHSFGINLLLPDQRSHGNSEGRWITFGVRESNDMCDWIAYHNRKHGNLPLILSGLSMGASTMMYLADAELPDNVKGMIVDCGFTSPHDIIGKVYRSMIHLPAGPAMWITNVYSRWIGGFGLRQHDSRISLKNSRLPVLMVHGTADELVPHEMSCQGYDACGAKKKLLLVDDAKHGHSFLVDREKYVDSVTEYLKENLNIMIEKKG